MPQGIACRPCIDKKDMEVLIRAFENYGSILDDFEKKGTHDFGAIAGLRGGEGTTLEEERRRLGKLFDQINNMGVC